MTSLPEAKKPQLPNGVVLDKPTFVPRMVMTDELKVVAKDVINQWKNRDMFAGLIKYGIRPLDRLLFHGPPGNGKTMACFWIAQQLQIPVYRVLCNQMHLPYLGETENAVASVLDYFNARTEPALCLWDEAEAIFIDRAIAQSGGDRAIASATAIMLQGLDRWRSPVLMVMATNLPAKLDPALLSRVEARLLFPGPTPEQCRQMIEYWSELLHEHGSEEWAPVLADRIKTSPPESFRELQQWIGFCAREWTAKQCKKAP
jgi:SpoVK/Ycf46/Vps4 family AAA+-type ATPase